MTGISYWMKNSPDPFFLMILNALIRINKIYLFRFWCIRTGCCS